MTSSNYIKYTLFILFLYFPFVGVAQYPLLDSLKKIFTQTELQNWRTSNQPKKTYGFKTTLKGEFNKNIAFMRIFADEVYYVENNVTPYSIFALFNKSSDSIIYMKAFAPSLNYIYDKEDKSEYEIITKSDTLAIHNFLQWYNTFFETQKSIDTIIQELMQEEYYGYVCFDAGSPTKQILELSSLKKKKDKRKLLNEWLRSANPELQTYGMEELKRLKVKLTAKEQEIIKFLEGLNVEILTCGGCFTKVVKR